MPETPPFIPFRFSVQLLQPGTATLVCGAAFSEVSGLEVTMAPKKIAEGGRNWGEVVRVGTTTFSPVTLKRGVTSLDDLWRWFDVVSNQANYGYRLDGRIEVIHDAGADRPLLTWTLRNVLPIKFKGPDLSATSNAVAIEEIQLQHEGLELARTDGT